MRTITITIGICLFILVNAVVFSFLVDYQAIVVTRQEINSSLRASGMAGFSATSLEDIAVRNDINSSEMRNIVLNKPEAIRITEEYIRKNLKLDDENIALENSIISDKVNPIIIDITVNNAGENGYTFTTITIEADIPFKLTNAHGIYAKKIVDVDYSTFLVGNQN